MIQGKLIFSLVAITVTHVLLPTQARPQSDFNDLFAVDGFAFDGPAEGLDPITFERTTASSTVGTSTAPTSPDRCLNTCQTTSEYNPVCGTDGVVYSNPGRLGCAQRCGRAVNLVNYGSCASQNARG